ncbi:hypothetical protein TraAM80_09818 [Trypanosoma rangeli]|uniref:Uncharacterized protein n=1 Tax=Trypanosoma rangeli TaxID=5698 RepID=A0A422MT62_TRYRA|nr:uncharacterized protein TraAM80_09818 [Trypanosoma rangeli]RNE96390.1 hypothetical protein TraAM80_09818 [Trypanosoma rangeli]|eukprot:RNE96390.1 hypothetical protein TraAM80_09818 [Trypanosoma rangeli]
MPIGEDEGGRADCAGSMDTPGPSRCSCVGALYGWRLLCVSLPSRDEGVVLRLRCAVCCGACARHFCCCAPCSSYVSMHFGVWRANEVCGGRWCGCAVSVFPPRSAGTACMGGMPWLTVQSTSLRLRRLLQKKQAVGDHLARGVGG